MKISPVSANCALALTKALILWEVATIAVGAGLDFANDFAIAALRVRDNVQARKM
jgi:hypothetical protein